MSELKLVYKKVSDIFEYDKNPRKNDPAVNAVANSIKEFGFKVPIIIDCNNVIVAGHTRIKAARLLGIEKIPCICANDLTEQQIKAFRLADNKVAELSGWDEDLLLEELKDITDIDMSLFEFDCNELEDECQIQVDTIPDIPQQPKARHGDIYQLGAHRLMCGDSTNNEDVNNLVGGGTVDLFITDPPYNVNYEGKTSKKMKIANDHINDQQFRSFLTGAFQNANSVMKKGAAFYIWFSSVETVNFYNACNNAGLPVHQQLIWNKNAFVLSRTDYQNKFESCLYGWKEGAPHYFIKKRNIASVINENELSDYELSDIEPKRIFAKIIDNNTEKNEAELEIYEVTVIDEKKLNKNDVHPTMKPVGLFAKQIENSTRKGEIVLDLFCGSGTAIIACEQLGRACYAMEYDPAYVDVIIERWERFTGEKAILIKNTKEN